MRILLGGLNQEVNSFSPGKTTIEEYKRKQYCLGDDMIKAAAGHVRAYSDLFDAMGGAYNVLASGGAEVVSGGFAGAQSGGIIEQSVLDGYIAHIKQAAKNSLPLDGVVLVMHGAAQSAGSDDPEGDIIVAVREIVGKDVPISVSLDLHANVTERMAKNAEPDQEE